MRYIHQLGDNKHRLGRTKYDAKSPNKESPVIWGEWASYRAPAMLGQYLAVTDYYATSAEFPNPRFLYRVQSDVWPLETVTAEPLQVEFSLQCSGGLEIVGNDLATVLHKWREYCAEVEVADVISLNRVV